MAKELTELEKHYNKFNEEKRLGRRHGQVEYRITMEYIRRYLKEMEQPKSLMWAPEPDGIRSHWQTKAMMSQRWNS